jgi:predicted nucleotidyltransferase
MKYLNKFELVSTEMQRKKVSCILIGGFAINFYNVVRQTVDIDFLITKNDFEKILPALHVQGYKVMRQSEVFANLESSDRHLLALDYMFIDQDVFGKILKDGRKVQIAKGKFTIPSLNHLIALKLHSIKGNPKRELKDLPDIVGLIENNGVDVRSKSFEQLCLKYGNPGLLEKIRNFFGG